MELQIETPRWALPLLEPARYKGAFGGRSSGKSHFFAEYVVEQMVMDPHLPVVCVREIQKSLTFSAKKLIENKIRKLQVEHLFDAQSSLIKRNGGTGVCIFQGMQDHTADSIKSLEDFRLAWVEEAHRLSQRSLDLLRPTIRAPGSELLFSWNPDQPEDAVDAFFRQAPPEDAIVVNVNWHDNPFLPDDMRAEIEYDRQRDPEAYAHIWEGGYNTISDAQIFAGRYRIEEFEPGEDWDGPYYGADFGFALDPTVLVKCWLHKDRVWIEKESGKVGLDIDRTADLWFADIPEARKAKVRADSARPETISYLSRHGFPFIEGVEKWQGSVEDGVDWLRTRGIVIHPRCTRACQEARLYRYKVNQAGDVLAKVEDAHNHVFDATRYAFAPLIQKRGRTLIDAL